MKLWPFGERLEQRASYSDAVVAALVSRNDGATLALPSATGALEAASGTISRAFAASEVSGPEFITRALTPATMALIGRELIRRGEVVFMIDTSAGLKLIPAQAWDITGDPDPASWTYRLDLAGPSRTVTYDSLPASGCLHFRYAVSPGSPWSANGPIQVAALAGKLSAEVARVLGEEVSGPVGRLLGIPVDGQDSSVSGLKSDIASARGRTAIVESGDWGAAGDGRLGPQKRTVRPRSSKFLSAAAISGLPGGVRGLWP